MSLILPSTSAPAPRPSAAAASTRHDEPAPGNPGSFGEALARSLAPATEKTDQAAAKTAPAQPGRRQADPEKADAQDLANAMVLSLLAVEARVPQAALPGGTGRTTASTAPGTPLTSLKDLLAGTAAGAGAAVGAVSGAGAASASAVADGAVEVIAADADTPPQLASVLAAGNQKMAGALPLPAGLTPVSDGAALEIDPLLPAAAQAGASSPGLPVPNASGTGKQAPDQDLPGDARPDLKLAARQDRVKVTASGAAENAPAPGLPVAGGQAVAEAATTATSTALPTMMPATAALQAPGGAAAPNAPLPVATATLTPEVGSHDWGKALGQQMSQMGHAGHAGSQVAELQLNPPGLGPLKVTLSMSDHQMQAMFVSAHSSVRAAVEAALPQLRAMLADSGISLGNTSVGAESQQQTAFSNHQNHQAGRGAYRPDAGMGADADAGLAAQSTAEPVRRNSGLRIDTFA